MSWRDELLDASFRGERFKVDRHDTSYARRVVVHEYPFRDLPETEDLGESAVNFSFDAYVLGEDYFTPRDALLNALRRPGPGELVHPYLGTFQCIAIDFRLSETTREGGRASFSISFLRVQDVELPFIETDTQQAVADAAEAADAATEAAFTDSFKPTAYDALQAALRSVTSAFEAVEQGLAQLEAYAALANRLLLLPSAIVARVQGALARLGGLRLRVLAGFGTGRHSDRAIDAANNAAVEQLVQASAVIALARISAATEYTSYDEAITTRDELLLLIEQVQDTASDELYASLVELRRSLAADIEARAADLRRLTRLTLPETTPALALVQRLYGPADLDADLADLLARNGIDEPLFVPGGVSLEVLAA